METAAPADNTLSRIPVAVLLSGGIDSGCCLTFFRERGNPVRAIHFSYGQPAAAPERAAAVRLAEHFRVSLQVIETSGMPTTGLGEIRGRNAFFLFGALMSLTEPAALIAMGVHAGTEYYDCSRAFIELTKAAFDGYSAGRVNVVTPFLEFTKTQIWNYARRTGFPIAHSYSCRRGTVPPCGECLSCMERKELNALSN